MGMPKSRLEHLNGFGFPMDLRSMHGLSLGARVGVVLRCAVWTDIWDRIRIAADSDDAFLHPRRE